MFCHALARMVYRDKVTRPDYCLPQKSIIAFIWLCGFEFRNTTITGLRYIWNRHGTQRLFFFQRFIKNRDLEKNLLVPGTELQLVAKIAGICRDIIICSTGNSTIQGVILLSLFLGVGKRRVPNNTPTLAGIFCAHFPKIAHEKTTLPGSVGAHGCSKRPFPVQTYVNGRTRKDEKRPRKAKTGIQWDRTEFWTQHCLCWKISMSVIFFTCVDSHSHFHSSFLFFQRTITHKQV